MCGSATASTVAQTFRFGVSQPCLQSGAQVLGRRIIEAGGDVLPGLGHSKPKGLDYMTMRAGAGGGPEIQVIGYDIDKRAIIEALNRIDDLAALGGLSLLSLPIIDQYLISWLVTPPSI